MLMNLKKIFYERVFCNIKLLLINFGILVKIRYVVFRIIFFVTIKKLCVDQRKGYFQLFCHIEFCNIKLVLDWRSHSCNNKAGCCFKQ